MFIFALGNLIKKNEIKGALKPINLNLLKKQDAPLPSYYNDFDYQGR